MKLFDLDSALDVIKVQTRHSVLRQFYRNNPSGTPGYRPPEYVLVAPAHGMNSMLVPSQQLMCGALVVQC